jgi:lysophospholipase L1-like esterase
VFDQIPLNGDDFVFLGDSITEGCEWDQQFQDLDVKNLGIGGDTTQGVLHRLQMIASAKPEKIFLMIGINDLSAGRTISSILNDYRQILSDVIGDSPATHIYVQSVLPINSSMAVANYGIKTKNDTIVALNAGLAKMSNELGLTYIDLYSSFVQENQLNRADTYDGVHLNANGYALWKQIVNNYVINVSN